jgi:RNA polymerase sigma-70 factor, ECF subfamily
VLHSVCSHATGGTRTRGIRRKNLVLIRVPRLLRCAYGVSIDISPRRGRRDGALAADFDVPGRSVSRAREDARLIELIEQVARGNEDAISELYDITSSRVYGAVLRMLHYPELAAEVTQQIYLEIWRDASRYDPSKSSALAWIMTLAHNRSVDRVRTVSMESARERYAALNGDRVLDRTGDQIGRGPQAELARDAMRSLTDIQRQVLTLTYFAGFSQSEVAQILGLPLDTVKARIRDGLIGLRNALGVGT